MSDPKNSETSWTWKVYCHSTPISPKLSHRFQFSDQILKCISPLLVYFQNACRYPRTCVMFVTCWLLSQDFLTAAQLQSWKSAHRLMFATAINL